MTTSAMTPAHYALSRTVADEQFQTIKDDYAMPLGERAWAVMVALTYIVGDLDENYLREAFTLSGVDLTDEDQFFVASETASLFSKGGAVCVNGLHFPSLIDEDGHNALRYIFDEDVRHAIDDLHGNGILFRAMMLEQVKL
jgi:hypothetical protein